MNLDLFPALLAVNKYRLIDVDLPRIFNLPSGLLIVAGLIALSFAIGVAVANAMRLRDYGWKVGLILSTFLVSTFLVLFGEFKLGVDLKGGVILVYEVDEAETQALNPKGKAEWEMGQLITVLTRRLNPEGLKEIVVRPFGPMQVEIVVPETDPQEVELIKEKIRTGGVLQFMIVASDRDTELIELARQQAELGRLEDRLKRDVVNQEGRRVGFWARMGREDGDPATAPFRSPEVLESGTIRDARTGGILDIPPGRRLELARSDLALKAFLAERGVRDIDVLMVYDPDFDIRGEDLGYVQPGRDEQLRPCILFSMKGDGVFKMGYLTQNNIQRKLAIIFDNVVLSAPVIQSKISDNGQITGNFTQEHVNFIVSILRSGSMPVVMKKQPISENQIGAILGWDTIVRGSYSIGISLLLVLGFTWSYYRFAGFVACCALILNLLLVLALMILLKAPLTLPGLAGLVLTVGMSVDSNVLIFERIREELQRGAALRMAIRNGFDRAIVTIIDSNLTTLLTAVVLYFIGTDQVKGFGITLILGILTSMFTAIFAARTVFEMGERSRWIKTLRMTHFLTNPQVNWVRWFGPATIASVVVIGIGLVATVARGKGLFDIDLAGGTSVTFVLKEPLPVGEVRAKLDRVLPALEDPETKTRVQYVAYELPLYGKEERPHTVYKIDSSLSDVEMLKQKIREALKAPDGSELLKTYHVQIGTIKEEPLLPQTQPALSAPGKAQPPVEQSKQPSPPSPTEKKDQFTPAGQPQQPASQPGEKADEKAVEKTGAAEAPKPDQPPPSEPSQRPGSEPPPTQKQEPQKSADSPTPPPDGEEEEELEPEADNKKVENEQSAKQAEPVAEKKEPATGERPVPPAAAESQQAASPPARRAAPSVKTVTTLRFPDTPLTADALKDRIKQASMAAINQVVDDVRLENPNWDGQDNSAFESWTVTLMGVDQEQAETILNHLQSTLRNEVIWQTSSKFGGQVSADMRYKAVTAIVVSLLGIIAYMWFRFQKVIWGIAAVVALAHDTLVMLGGIAVSYWLADALGFVGVEQFKISLPVVAAFLTLIGFSVNDTIVIFDRIREIRGKSPDLTAKMLNDSVNQTMSRTIITSGTVFMVVVVLYFFGGPGIHAFAFSLVIGVISGTYSTVYIAAPLLLWLFHRQASTAGPAGRLAAEPTKSVA